MHQPLTAFHPLPRSAAVAHLFQGDPSVWLPDLVRPLDDDWVIRLHAGPVSHTVLCHVGDPFTRDGSLWRAISWVPSDADGHIRLLDALLPEFDGDLGLLEQPGPSLVLTGSYQPPGGGVGAAIDRVGLERVADATARRWLARVAKQLARPVAPVPS